MRTPLRGRVGEVGGRSSARRQNRAAAGEGVACDVKGKTCVYPSPASREAVRMRASPGLIWTWVNHAPGVWVRTESIRVVNSSLVRDPCHGVRRDQSGAVASGVRIHEGGRVAAAVGWRRQPSGSAAMAVEAAATKCRRLTGEERRDGMVGM